MHVNVSNWTQQKPHYLKPLQKSGRQSHGAAMHGLIDRLKNWGRWGRLDPDKPRCAISRVFEMMVSRDEGFGEVTETTVIVHQEPITEAPDIDDADAESLDFYIRQLAQVHRSVLVRNYVQLERLTWDVVDPSVRALDDAIQANKQVNDYMRGRV